MAVLMVNAAPRLVLCSQAPAAPFPFYSPPLRAKTNTHNAYWAHGQHINDLPRSLTLCVSLCLSSCHPLSLALHANRCLAEREKTSVLSYSALCSMLSPGTLCHISVTTILSIILPTILFYCFLISLPRMTSNLFYSSLFYST